MQIVANIYTVSAHNSESDRINHRRLHYKIIGANQESV